MVRWRSNVDGVLYGFMEDSMGVRVIISNC